MKVHPWRSRIYCKYSLLNCKKENSVVCALVNWELSSILESRVVEPEEKNVVFNLIRRLVYDGSNISFQ